MTKKKVRQHVVPSRAPHAWSKDALLTKAQRYAEQMLEFPHDDWRFGLWSTFALELLARSALAQVNPTLLADAKDWNNLYYALGHESKASKFTPRSIDTSVVLARLKEILPSFRQDLEGFCLVHISRRNEELHSGTSPFDSIASSAWLPTFYEACEVLTASVGSSLDILLGTQATKVAREMIAAAHDETAKAVLKSVQAHKTVWNDKNPAQRKELLQQASNWALRHDGHRVACPACASDALLFGTASAAPIKTIKGDQITESQQYLPAKFECIACGLKINGYSQLNACGLGDTFKATFTYDAAEYYAPNDEYVEYEPDFND